MPETKSSKLKVSLPSDKQIAMSRTFDAPRELHHCLVKRMLSARTDDLFGPIVRGSREPAAEKRQHAVDPGYCDET